MRKESSEIPMLTGMEDDERRMMKDHLDARGVLFPREHYDHLVDRVFGALREELADKHEGFEGAIDTVKERVFETGLMVVQDAEYYNVLADFYRQKRDPKYKKERFAGSMGQLDGVLGVVFIDLPNSDLELAYVLAEEAAHAVLRLMVDDSDVSSLVELLEHGFDFDMETDPETYKKSFGEKMARAVANKVMIHMCGMAALPILHRLGFDAEMILMGDEGEEYIEELGWDGVLELLSERDPS